MRELFIKMFEVLVGVIVVLLGLVVLIAAGAATFGSGGMGPNGPSGPLGGLLILIGGGIYVVFLGGAMYLGLGIYQNTKRTAEAIERLAAK
ncbi:MAG: hypothetical protein WCC57_06405 [Paracoccaceae bacterium]